jgi:tRNA1Val (adenine37-N6)-methyltransferase
MGVKPFQFKLFSVAHDRCTHKVGTDGVLLGSWVTIQQHDNLILDIGTGSGLIALMLAQRSKNDVHIDAIEMERTDAEQAKENIANSPWPGKITVITEAVQQYASTRPYDLIVSNPPFFLNSLLPPGEKRTKARHTQSLTFEELLDTVNRLLAPEGRFALILPHAEGLRFIELARKTNLLPFRKTTFRSRRHKPVERLLIEFSRKNVEMIESDIILYANDEDWTAEYQELTGAFYLEKAGIK